MQIGRDERSTGVAAEPFRASNWLIILVFAVGYLATVAVYLDPGARETAAKIWSTDYPSLSTAHALSMDYRQDTGVERRLMGMNTIHPGAPFQWSSWMSLKLSCLAWPGDGGPCWGAVFNNPAGYWAVASLFHGLASIVALFLLLAVFPGGRWSAPHTLVIAVVFASPLSYSVLFLYPSNDSFALLFAVLLFAAFKGLISAIPGAGIGRILASAAGVGVILGLAYTSRLNYIVWTAAVFAILLLMLALQRGVRLRILMCLGVMVGAFVATFLTLVSSVLSPAAIMVVLNHHLRFATKTGMHGTGESGVIDPARVWEALQSYLQADWAGALITLMTLGLIAFHGLRLVRRDRGEGLGVNDLVFATFSMAFLLALLASLKHFNVYYTINHLVLLPFIWISAWDGLTARVHKAVVIVLAGLMVVAILGSKQYLANPRTHFEEGVAASVAADRAVVERVREILRARDQRVAFGYDTGTEQSWATQSASWSDIKATIPVVDAAYPGARYYDRWNRKVRELDGRWTPIAEKPVDYILLRTSDPVPEPYSVVITGAELVLCGI